MKNIIKKSIITICAVSISAMFAATAALATDTMRSAPGNTSGTSSVTSDVNTTTGTSAGTQVGTDTTAASANAGTVNTTTASTGTNTVNTVTNTANTTTQKKYLSKMGGFLWFLLSVVVNFVLSCWIGNRFYKLTKKSAQSSNEIRALRKDIEEKFSSSLRDISEPAVEVINRNENYARTDEGISMPERKNKVEISNEEREIMRRWDSKRSNKYDEEREEEFDSEPYEDDFEKDNHTMERHAKAPKRSYQPTRRSLGIDFEDEDEYEEEEEEYERRSRAKRPARMERKTETSQKTRKKSDSKVKKFVREAFPFND